MAENVHRPHIRLAGEFISVSERVGHGKTFDDFPFSPESVIHLRILEGYRIVVTRGFHQFGTAAVEIDKKTPRTARIGVTILIPTGVLGTRYHPRQIVERSRAARPDGMVCNPVIHHTAYLPDHGAAGIERPAESHRFGEFLQPDTRRMVGNRKGNFQLTTHDTMERNLDVRQTEGIFHGEIRILGHMAGTQRRRQPPHLRSPQVGRHPVCTRSGDKHLPGLPHHPVAMHRRLRYPRQHIIPFFHKN